MFGSVYENRYIYSSVINDVCVRDLVLSEQACCNANEIMIREEMPILD